MLLSVSININLCLGLDQYSLDHWLKEVQLLIKVVQL